MGLCIENMPVSKATKQSVDTTLPKNIRVWVRARDELVTAMSSGGDYDSKRLPVLAKELRQAEKNILLVKNKITRGEIAEDSAEYVREKYNEFVRGEDNRKATGQTQGGKKKTPFFKENGDAFSSQDITDAMRGGSFPAGFLANRLSNPNSAEFKDVLAALTPDEDRTAETRKSQTVEALSSPAPPKKETKVELTKEQVAAENQKIADAKRKKIIDDANAQIAKDKAKEEALSAAKAFVSKTTAKAKVAAEKKLEEDAKEKAEEEEGVTVSDAPDEPPVRRKIRGGGTAEVQPLEDVAEEEGIKGEPANARAGLRGGAPAEEYYEPFSDIPSPGDPVPPVPPPSQPVTETDALPDNRGTVEEMSDILDASRGGVGMTPSSIVQGSDSVVKEDAQRSKMKIARLKEEIRALHLIYDNNIAKFRSNPHKGDRDDALKSNDVAVVRRHHRDMEKTIREYYRSGGGDTLQVGVIVPIDTYLQQYLTGGTPAEQAVSVTRTAPTTGKEGTTSVGIGHRDKDLKSKSHDPYSRAVAQGIYYQRGGMSSYKQRAVSGHTIKIGGKDRVGAVKDPRTYVDAPMNNFLNRAVIEIADPTLRLKTK